MNSKVKESIIDALRECAKNGFILSQTNCPSQEVKESGILIDEQDGSALSYKSNKASFVERGKRASIELVKGHSKGKSSVKSYVRKSPAIEGSHFIEGSLKESFKTFGDTLDSSLQSKFSNVTRV
jgi:hypothetical protein